MMTGNEETAIVVGAGLAGICVSYYLSANNIPHIVLEKKDELGGIWSSLKWPGIRCDTEIINYSYSFKPFLSDHYLVPGQQISGYLKSVADEFGVTARTRFGTEVKKAEFSEKDNQWVVHTNNGTFRSRFLINANGYFTDKPYVPDFEGADSFKGEIKHLFDIDDRFPLAGRRVILVGSGASAISAVPAIRAAGAELTLLQRSPSYIFEQNNDAGLFIRLAQKLYGKGFKLPVKIVNYFLQLKYDLVFLLFRNFPWIGKLFFRLHWKGVVDDKTYKEHFRPAYGPWEQRIPVSIGLKDLLRKKEIRIVTGAIKCFSENGLVLDDGRTIETDLCILATGFNLCFFQFDMLVNGKPVDTRQINFYKSMMMGGIPNYFQPFGPPHTSFTRRIETISRLIVKIIQYMDKNHLDTVQIERKPVEQAPRITPNYIMRDISKLPAFYGSKELPSIDNLFFYHFRVGNYVFSPGKKEPLVKFAD